MLWASLLLPGAPTIASHHGCLPLDAQRAERVYLRRRPEQTALYEVVRVHAATFLAEARERSASGHGLPRYIEREIERYLECGILCHGFARVRCDGCGDELLVAYSCKGRGLCPSCTGRRMVDGAAHLVDRVLPPVATRQWVLSFPYRYRLRLARDPALLFEVLARFLRAIFLWQRRAARREGIPRPLVGAVTALQLFGSSLNLHPHFHALVPDGVFTVDDDRAQFHQLPPPDDAEVARILRRTLRRILPLLEAADADPCGDDALDTLRAGAAQRPLGFPTAPTDTARPARPRNAFIEGFSLDASVRVHGNDDQGRERLARYILRPPFAAHRLELLPDGRVRYRARRARPGAPRELILEPKELLRRLVALIPPPRVDMVRYHGVFAPYAKHRDAVVHLAHDHAAAIGTERPAAKLCRRPRKERRPAPTTERYLDWATLLKRTFAVDVLACTRCGGRRRLIVFITDPVVVRQILTHLGLPTSPPERLPARAPPQCSFLDFADPPSFDG